MIKRKDHPANLILLSAFVCMKNRWLLTLLYWYLQKFVLGIADTGAGIYCWSCSVYVWYHSSPGSSVYNTDSLAWLDSLHLSDQTRLLISRIWVCIGYFFWSNYFISFIIIHFFVLQIVYWTLVSLDWRFDANLHSEYYTGTGHKHWRCTVILSVYNFRYATYNAHSFTWGIYSGNN